MPTPIPETITSFNINMSDVGSRRQAFAAEAGGIFALWASVEYLLGTTATVLLGDAAALALLDTIRGRHQQMDALRRAAEEKIPHEETKKLVSHVFTFVNRAAMARNKLAHCVWGTLEELPNAILLTEIDQLLKATRLMLAEGVRDASISEKGSVLLEHQWSDFTSADRGLEIIHLMRDGTEVWTQADFVGPRKLLNKAIVALTFLTTAVSQDPSGNEATEARRQLTLLLAQT